MYQTALHPNIGQSIADGFQRSLVPVTGNTVYLYTHVFEVTQVFIDLLIVLTLGKANQLGVTCSMVLVSQDAKAAEISGIYAQVSTQ